MDYNQHKDNLRGQIKNKVERKLYNKRIRVKTIDEFELDYCVKCFQMTNHLQGVCQKCNNI